MDFFNLEITKNLEFQLPSEHREHTFSIMLRHHSYLKFKQKKKQKLKILHNNASIKLNRKYELL